MIKTPIATSSRFTRLWVAWTLTSFWWNTLGASWTSQVWLQAICGMVWYTYASWMGIIHFRSVPENRSCFLRLRKEVPSCPGWTCLIHWTVKLQRQPSWDDWHMSSIAEVEVDLQTCKTCICKTAFSLLKANFFHRPFWNYYQLHMLDIFHLHRTWHLAFFPKEFQGKDINWPRQSQFTWVLSGFSA